MSELLNNIPDKTEDKNTTSLKFKKDLISYLGDKYKDKVCVEIGTSKGYTTRILSSLFRKVITCEISEELVNFAKDVNKDRNNIEFIMMDVYQGGAAKWDFVKEDVDVVFIDCDHKADHVLFDINNAIKLCKPNEEILIIFDDYGLNNMWKGVKEAVDATCHSPNFNIVKEIGQKEGWSYRDNMTLRASEGVICTYTNKEIKKEKKFWRFVDDKLYEVGTTYDLGFPKDDLSYIPDEYLEKEVFTICRSCLGIGDWGVISSMPRLLKAKYPNCVVQIPSEKLLKSLLEPFAAEWLRSWKNPYKTMEYIFRNNPYVDAFVDSVSDEIFHDHYRIYNPKKSEIPLVEQMLDFWQFTPEEYEDSSPELYFTDEEKEIGDAIIEHRAPNGFGTFLLSNRFDESRDTEFIEKALDKHKIPYFYWVSNPSLLSLFDVDTVFDMRNVSVRVQMYLKTKAKVLIGNMSGADIMFPRYTKVYMAPRGHSFKENIVRGNLVTKIEDI